MRKKSMLREFLVAWISVACLGWLVRKMPFNPAGINPSSCLHFAALSHLQKRLHLVHRESKVTSSKRTDSPLAKMKEMKETETEEFQENSTNAKDVAKAELDGGFADGEPRHSLREFTEGKEARGTACQMH